MKKRVFSGIQPTGKVHIGNYLGAIKQWVSTQGEHENIYCIVDLHAITVPQDPVELKNSIRTMAGLLFAAGIDPEHSVLFAQSAIPAHSELAWILNCNTPMGWMERMTQFKEKAGKDRERASVGLFDYPALMAADILLYDTHLVPVGDDQKQHLELTRDIAQRFNRQYGDTFVVPKPIIPKTAARVMGLDNPAVKMSKSLAHVRGHAIRLLDDPKEIERSFKRAVTDSGREIVFSDDPEKAGVNNLLGIYKAVTGKSEADVLADFADARGYGDLKKRVAEVVIAEITPIRERYDRLMDDPAELDNLLARGAEQAAAVSNPKVDQMKEIMGLVLPVGSVQ